MLIDGLNPAQAEAVSTLAGPLVVVAGPGSGKTRVLTHRVVALLDSGVAPWQILAVTFTNKAAAEMRERLAALVGTAAVDGMWVSTFHAACVRIIRANSNIVGLPSSFSIYDSSDSAKVMRDVMSTLFGAAPEAGDVRDALAIVSRAKNAAWTPERLAVDGRAHERSVARLWTAYDSALRAAGAVDFDDLLLLARQLLMDPSVGDRYRSKFRHVLIDEFQDTNKVQYDITRLLLNSDRNLCVVGDLDQAVYSFRGAAPELMARITDDFPDARVVVLEQNYRSTKAILEVAQAVIDPNPAVFRARLFTENDQGSPVRMLVAADDRDEAAWVVSQVAASADDGASHAILVRTNAQTRSFEEQLTARGIPYRVIGALRFYDRAEVKDALSYLRLVTNPADTLAFSRAAAAPRRGVGPAALEVVTGNTTPDLAIVDRLREVVADGAAGRSGVALKRFLDDIDTVARAAQDGPSEALKAVLDRVGLARHVRSLERGDERVENLDELVSSAAAFEDDVRAREGLAGISALERFLEQLALVSSTDDDGDEPGGVILLTAHASKGKEFDHVWVAGVENDFYPHQRSKGDATAEEEERRLLFVACSRARKTLTLTRASSRMLYGKVTTNAPSPFLEDIPPQLLVQVRPTRSTTNSPSRAVSGLPAQRPQPIGPRLDSASAKVGARVNHEAFGAGVVTAAAGTRVVVVFDVGTEKTLDIQYAPLTLL